MSAAPINSLAGMADVPQLREVPLARAPLARVIAQIRYPVIAALESMERVAPFQDGMRADYPVLRSQRGQGYGLTGAVPPALINITEWHFLDATEDWQVTLTPDFVALQTKRYTSRDEFFSRLGRVLELLQRQFEPARVDRLGLRYINRVAGEVLQQLPRLVRQEIIGIATNGNLLARIQQCITETTIQFDVGLLLARWGYLPPNATTDQSLDPLPERSWFLDLDLSCTGPGDFSVERLTTDARNFAQLIYESFRWAVNDDFLRAFGGTP